MTRSPLALLLVLLAAAVPPLLSACAPVIVAGAAGAALVATDRRSAGAQLDDTTIETKLLTTVAGRYGDTVHFNVTSYNGMVLLTGEVPDAAVRADIYALARGTDRVRSVHDELVVGPNTDLGARTNDSYVTSKVKGGNAWTRVMRRHDSGLLRWPYVHGQCECCPLSTARRSTPSMA